MQVRLVIIKYICYFHFIASKLVPDHGPSQHYWNRRFAIPGFWQTQALHGKQIFPVFPIKWCHKGAQNFSTKELHFCDITWWEKPVSMEHAYLPKPRNSKPSISIMLVQAIGPNLPLKTFSKCSDHLIKGPTRFSNPSIVYCDGHFSHIFVVNIVMFVW